MIPPLFQSHKKPRVTLVGAGPGDPELLTMKAHRVLQEADVVLFDALVSKSILDLIPPDTPLFSVGKRAGTHSYTQDQINNLIVELAYHFGHVVRLKGGDPFVFGRGSEEIMIAEANGVETAVVPGISSSIAVPAALQIPVTARGISEGFWVITGTTQSGKLSEDIALAAKSTATVVILMGISRIEQIMECFQREGRNDTLVAVIQNGTMPNQKSVIGKVSNISQLMKNEDINSPGVIVVGEVVRYAKLVDKIVSDATLKNYE